MLPRHNKISSPQGFSAALRGSMKAGTGRVVVYRNVVDSPDVVDPGQARLGLIVSKAVGDAVTRHRVARRLRHIGTRLLKTQRRGTRIVIRALPRAASATSQQLEDDITRALARIERRQARRVSS